MVSTPPIPSWLAALPLLAAAAAFLQPRRPDRGREALVPPAHERVVVLGASSGVGEGLARECARRGSRICLVARRPAELERVRADCAALYPAGKAHEVLVVPMDISDPAALVHLREVVQEAWGGLDTLHIISGLPSTQRLMALAGEDDARDDTAAAAQPTVQGLAKVQEEARRVGEVNVVGVALAVAAFLPLLRTTSPAPLIHHLSSLAAVFPAPTRALYSATKAGGLGVFRTAGWEQLPDRARGERTVRFLAILPGTIDTEFRRKSQSAQEGKKPSEEFEKRTLTVEQTVQAILDHSARSPSPSPVTLPIPFLPLALRIPFLRLPPNDLIYLPEFPYRIASFALDSWAVGTVRRSARRKYGLE